MSVFFFFSSRRRHTRWNCDWSSDVCSSDLSPAGTAKGADPHYSVMSLDAIKALPVGQLARGDCLLLLWSCGWAIATGQAQEVARAWGFTPQSEMVWRKLTASGKPRMGTGYRVRTLHEPILLATIGH